MGSGVYRTNIPEQTLGNRRLAGLIVDTIHHQVRDVLVGWIQGLRFHGHSVVQCIPFGGRDTVLEGREHGRVDVSVVRTVSGHRRIVLIGRTIRIVLFDTLEEVELLRGTRNFRQRTPFDRIVPTFRRTVLTLKVILRVVVVFNLLGIPIRDVRHLGHL